MFVFYYNLSEQDVTTLVYHYRAYSVDKEYRLRMGYRWFADEQPSDAIKEYVEQQLDKTGWKEDTVLSHTCPRKYEPVEHFMPGIDQSRVDKSTEN